MKDAVAEMRADSEKLRESFGKLDSGMTEADRDNFRRFVDNVDFLCSYVGDKLPILVDVATGEGDRLHIAMVVSVHLEDAAGGSGGFKDDLHVDDAGTGQAEESAARSLISVLRERLKRFGEEFSRLVCGLLTPKEWTVSGKFENVVFFAKAGVGVEIKFGR